MVDRQGVRNTLTSVASKIISVKFSFHPRSHLQISPVPIKVPSLFHIGVL